MKILVILLFATINMITSCAEETDNTTNAPFNAGLLEPELWEPPDDAIFINPENNDQSRDGSIEKPYNSFSEFQWSENTTIAVKRGTEIIIESLKINANNITIGSYGDDKTRPVLMYNGNDHAITTKFNGVNNLTIRDVSISAKNAVSCIYIRDNSENISINNCRTEGSEWGIRALDNINNIEIINTEIFNILDDGIYIQNSENITISHCHIYKVNQYWTPPSTSEEIAAGDGIQLRLCNNFKISNSIIDRSDNENKFCIISNNPDQDNGIIEYNILKGPGSNGANIYLSGGSGLTIRYNFFHGPSDYSIFTHSDNNNIYYNVFIDMNGPLLFSKTAFIFNNLFYHCSQPIEGETATVRNNIFNPEENEQATMKVGDLTESNNLYTSEDPTDLSINGNPDFVDEAELNFRIGPNSTCIDSGADVGINMDIEGNEVPNGSAADIGPYEYIK